MAQQYEAQIIEQNSSYEQTIAALRAKSEEAQNKLLKC